VVAAVVPLLIFGLGAGLVAYAIFYVQFETEARARLEAASNFLAHSGRLGLITRSTIDLREPIRMTLADADIIRADVYGPDGSVLYAKGEPEAPPSLPEAPGIGGADLRYRSLGSRFRELVRVVRYPSEGSEPAAGSTAGPGRAEGVLRLVMSTHQQAAEYRGMLIYSGLGVALMLALGTAIALGVSRRLVRGLDQLRAAARRIGTGELDVSIPVHGGRELNTLADAFSEMARDLWNAREKIREYQKDLERKVEVRTAELNAARLDAESSSRAKSHFLANMSHEIRTPMTAVLGYTDLLLDQDLSLPPAARDRLQVVRRNGTHLLAILNDILDISKIEAGRFELECITTDLREILSEVTSLLRVRAEEKGLELIVRYRTPLPTEVVTDPTRLRQALVNLIGNAIKFTSEGTVQIDVSYAVDGEILTFHVRDTGIGIAPEQLRTLFRAFEQADSSTSRRFGGTGLGLAITKRLAGLLAGDCVVESEVGRGSTFALTCHAPMAEGASRGELVDRPEADDPLEQPAPVGAPLAARILLAEDGLDNQRLISILLRKAGAEVEVVENGQLALERVQLEEFDLVLMDMAMPVMDGYEATRRIRAAGLELPIVALTAHAMQGERERCLELGCTEYLTKPVNRDELVGAIRSLLEKRPGS
jgi:signal transduction histidine kinase/CheY-like chemotaxis protein